MRVRVRLPNFAKAVKLECGGGLEALRGRVASLLPPGARVRLSLNGGDELTTLEGVTNGDLLKLLPDDAPAAGAPPAAAAAGAAVARSAEAPSASALGARARCAEAAERRAATAGGAVDTAVPQPPQQDATMAVAGQPRSPASARQPQQQTAPLSPSADPEAAAVSAACAAAAATSGSATAALLAAVEAAFQQRGFVPAEGVPVPPQTVPTALALRLQYAPPGSAAVGTAPVVCTVVADDLMGRWLVVYGAVEGAGAGAGAGGECESAVVRRACLDARAELLADGSLRDGGAGAWRLLRDELVQPLAYDARAALGLPPPAGLTALDRALQLRILAPLPASSLAALACTCRELRAAATDDRLWSALYRRNFGSVPTRPVAPGRWYRAYDAEARMREASRQERERQRREEEARRRAPVPLPGPMPGGPQPQPGPPQSLVIGGDYDRFPAGVPGLVPGHPGGLPTPFGGGGGGGGAFGRGLDPFGSGVGGIGGPPLGQPGMDPFGPGGGRGRGRGRGGPPGLPGNPFARFGPQDFM